MTLPVNALKVGQLAQQTGLSVRTLHYYDQIGLLSPSQRTQAEHRLYTAADVAKLQQIMSLRQLGFSLDEIRDCLNNPSFSFQRVVQLHIARLREQIELSQTLLQRLEAIASQAIAPSSTEELIQTIEAMTMLEKYYSPEQLQTLQQRRNQLGEAEIKTAEAEWRTLIAQAQAAMENGTDPGSEPVQQLARRWQELVAAFTGDNPEIAHSLDHLYQQEGPEAASQGMLEAAVFDYMGRAIAIQSQSS